MDRKEKQKLYMREYRKTEEYKNYMKEYRLKNKEKIKKQEKELNKQPHRIKGFRISQWKSRGVISDDYDKLYDYYLSVNNCDKCNVVLEGLGNNRKCLDHNHNTGLFRNILCHKCNSKLKNR